MPKVFGRENNGRLNRMVEILERSLDLEHTILAENMRPDEWVSPAREKVFEAQWDGPGRTAVLLFKAFQERCTQQVRRPGTKPEFLSVPLAGDCHASGVSNTLLLRQFLNISGLLAKFTSVPAGKLVRGDTDALKSESTIAERVRAMPDDDQKAVVRDVLEWARSHKPDYHPTWLTPVDPRSAPGAARIELQLASVGVFARNSIWIELRYQYWQLQAIAAVPTVLDGGSLDWYPAPSSASGAGLHTGFSMDLRHLVDANRGPFAELITVDQQACWLPAWELAGRQIFHSSRAMAESVCLLDRGVLKVAELRQRHKERLR